MRRLQPRNHWSPPALPIKSSTSGSPRNPPPPSMPRVVAGARERAASGHHPGL